MRRAYRGDQTIDQWLGRSGQVKLFEETPKDVILKRLTVIATRIVEDMGRDSLFVDLSDEVKKRAAGVITYDSALVALALQSAMRIRQQ